MTVPGARATPQTALVRAAFAVASGVVVSFVVTCAGAGLTACTSPAARSTARNHSGPDRTSPVTAASGQTTASGSTASTDPSGPATTPTAADVGLEPQVGPLFRTGDRQPHGCTASVVHSPGHDLILTAAHCVTGSGAGEIFAPDYRDGQEPFGAWRVERAWADPDWIASTAADDDVAVLQVAPRTVAGHVDQVEDLVGAETLGSTPPAGTRVEVVGYTQGIDDRQLTCANVLSEDALGPFFSCHGYEGGTSGSPFLTESVPRTVVGLVGGHDQGGCTEAVSYSPPFGAAVRAVLARAEAGTDPDRLPASPNDC